MTASYIQRNPSIEVENLILEYDISRIVLRRYGVFENDPVLRLFRTSSKTNVYILVCNREENLRRINETLSSIIKPKKKDIDKAERITSEYSKHENFMKIYHEWISFCKENNCTIKYIDIRGRVAKVVSEYEALKIIES